MPSPRDNVQLSLFADDTAIYKKSVQLPSAIAKVQKTIVCLESWFQQWRITINPEKSAAVCFDVKRRKKHLLPIRMFGSVIPWESKTKYLGVDLDARLTFRPHVDRVTRLARFYLGRLSGMLGRNSKMSLRNKRTLFKVCIRPVLTYASPVFAHASAPTLHKLQVVQSLFCRKATNAPWYVRNADLHRDVDLPTIQQLLKTFSEKFFKRSENHINPLIREASAYTPRPFSRHLVRRPRHVLSDPPNDLSAALNLLLEAQADSRTPHSVGAAPPQGSA